MTPNIVFQVFQLHRWALVIRAIRGVDVAVGCTRPTAAFATRCCLAGPAANIEGAPVAGGGMLDGRFALGTKITLTAADGFKLGGCRADPQGKPKGGLVVIQDPKSPHFEFGSILVTDSPRSKTAKGTPICRTDFVKVKRT